MFVTNHVIAGAAIGATINHPVPAFLAGVASHFAMDAAPHWGGIKIDDPRFMRIAKTDGTVGLTALAVYTVAAGDRWLPTLAGMAGAVLPDLDKPMQVYLGGHPFPKPWQDFHVGIQNEAIDRWPRELVFTAVAGVATLGLLRALARRK